jgi:hypothetical protein
MDEYLKNASQLSFWLTILTTVSVGLIVKYAFSYFKELFISFVKRLKINELTKIKNIRFNYSTVTYQIVKTHSLMLLFSGLCVFYLFIFSRSLDQSSGLLVILIKTLPLYIIELWYLNQISFTKKLMTRVGK